MHFTSSGQETEWALFLQPRSPHGAANTGPSHSNDDEVSASQHYRQFYPTSVH